MKKWENMSIGASIALCASGYIECIILLMMADSGNYTIKQLLIGGVVAGISLIGGALLYFVLSRDKGVTSQVIVTDDFIIIDGRRYIKGKTDFDEVLDSLKKENK